MLWLFMLMVAVVLATIGRRTTTTDDVYALALYVGSFLSGLWGLATAPSAIQVLVGIITLGGLKISSHKV